MANNTFQGKEIERVKLSDKYGNDLNGVIKVARLIAAANTDNPTAIASSAGASLRHVTGYNAKAGVLYFKLYDKATAPAAADTPILTIAIGASQNFSIPLQGLKVTNGIGFRLVTGSADNDNTAVAANDVVGMALYYDM